MNIINGNIWDHHINNRKIVITTNIGWDPVTGLNNMGAGLAWDAAGIWDGLREWYGKFCRITYPNTPVVEYDLYNLILMPVKPLLDINNPEISWNQRASIKLIEGGLNQLRHHKGEIIMAFPGCGNGGLSHNKVYKLLETYCSDKRFTIVDKSWNNPKA